VRSLAFAAALVAGCAAAAPDPDKERAEVPEAAAVSANGVRYQAPPFARALGLPHNGGYVEAIDESTGQRRWIVEVVPPRPDAGQEQDKRDIFIVALKLSPNGEQLLVTDELGRYYRLDLRSRLVAP
jgi:hypothetical protein